jgi:hypothetical protein
MLQPSATSISGSLSSVRENRSISTRFVQDQ